MKLLRVGPEGAERPALLDDDGRLLDLSGHCRDIDGFFLANGGVELIRAAHAAGNLPEMPQPARIGAPVARPGKVVCVGLNYRDHAIETGADIPAEPVLFLKASNTVIGPDDEVLIPRASRKTDYEVELAVVIGQTARYLSADQAASVIAGYAISNDVSEREFQLERGGTWDKGKSCETFNPLGPWLVIRDEIGVYEVIAYLSQFLVLEPGDVVNTGTPAGVALGRSEDAYLRPGAVVEVEIEKLGRQRQIVGQA